MIMQVSRPGSVQVEKLMNIERFSHVMHISSTVSSLMQIMRIWNIFLSGLAEMNLVKKLVS